MNFEEFRCKNCDAELDLYEAVGGVVACAYCGSKFTLPKKEQTSEVLSYLRMGQNELNCCAFERAYTAFEKAAELDESEPEAYFGMALAEYRVQYLKDVVKDERTGLLKNRLQPICHDMGGKLFSESDEYRRALACATEEQRAEYRDRAEMIDRIRREFHELSKTGLDYDCFICVKVTDENGNHTKDYELANELYFALRDDRYRPFFSERCIKNRAGSDYEAMILYALITSESMIVICSEEKYLRTPWVKNEYTRFLGLMGAEKKEKNSLTIGFFGKPIERLPGVSTPIQGIDLNKIDAIKTIEGFIDSHDPEKRRKKAARETAEKQAAEEAAARAREQARQEAAAREQENENRRKAAERQAAEAAQKAEEAARKAAELERQLSALREAQQQVAAQTAEREATDNQQAEGSRRLESLSAERNDNHRPKCKVCGSVYLDVSKARNGIVVCDGCFARNAVDLLQSADSASTQFSLSTEEFQIENGALVQYRGKGGRVVIPDGVTEIGINAFSGCGNVTGVAIPDSVSVIGRGAFEKCVGLTAIQIPQGVTMIGAHAFSDCGNLKTIELPPSVTEIGYRAFINCTALTAVVLPPSVTMIRSYTFYGCANLAAIRIPKSVTRIGRCAFENCSGLTEIEIPNGVTQIENSAFNACENLNTVTISKKFLRERKGIFGEQYKKILYAYYEDTAAITTADGAANPSASVSARSDFTVSREGVLEKYKGGGGRVVIPAGVQAIGDGAFQGCKTLLSVVLPSGVRTIGEKAFCDCERLKSVTLPYNLVAVGNRAFFGCFALETIVLPETVCTIGHGAFQDCYRLKNITIPNETEEIEDCAFFGCKELTAVTIPAGVKSIGIGVFGGCNKLQTLEVAKGNSTYRSVGNCIIDIKNKTLLAGCGNSVIPADGSVVKIEDNSFEMLESLQKIVIPDSVTEIGETAFYACENLEEVRFSKNLQTMGDNAFWSCKTLQEAILPSSLQTMGEGAFANCYALRTVEIPRCLTDIPEEAFLNNSGLVSLEIPDGVRTIGERAFEANSALQSVSIPPSVTEIGFAFDECENLQTVTLPERFQDKLDEIFSDRYEEIRFTLTKPVATSSAIASGEVVADGECDSVLDPLEQAAIDAVRASKVPLDFVRTQKPVAAEIVNQVLKNLSVAQSKPATPASSAANAGSAPAANSPLSDFAIQNGELTTYCGKGGDVVVPSGVKKIGYRAFYNQKNLRTVVLPEGVTEIGQSAFENSSLNRITLPQSLLRIGASAFKKSALVAIVISKNVNRIDTFAFSSCTLFNSIAVETGNTVFHSYGNCLIETKKKTLIAGCAASVIPSDGSVTIIGREAFCGRDSLRAITIPNSIRTIDDYAFGWTGLTALHIPAGVQEIGAKIINGCNELQEVTLPSGLQKVASGAFWRCFERNGYSVKKQLVIRCNVKKPLFGLPRGWEKDWEDAKTKVIWNNKD